MNRIALLIFALTSTVSVAQDAAKPPAQQCPKYQHVYHWPGQCGPSPCDINGCPAVCMPPPPDQCVDDMHEVTEEQWQALKTSIDLLKKMVLLEQKQINLIAGAKSKP